MTFHQLLINAKRALQLIRMLNYNPSSTIGPLCVDVAVTSKCNYRCYFCDAHSYLKKDRVKGENMPEEMVSALFQDFSELGVKEVLLSGNGEPLMLGHVRRLIMEFADRFQVKVLTNGSFQNKVTPKQFACLNKLTISLNTIDDGLHKLIHGYGGTSQLSRIVSDIERLLAFPHSRNRIQINYVMTSDNIGEFDDLIRLSQQWDVFFSIRPIYVDFAEVEPKKLDETSLKKIRDKAVEYLRGGNFSGRSRATLKLARGAFAKIVECNPDSLSPCYAGFFWGNIWSNGDYSQCVYTKTILGNINDRSFKEIWQNPLTQARLYTAALMHEAEEPAFPTCYGCEGGQMYSSLFHKLFRRIPLQTTLLRHWRNKKSC